jgi:hypothetical protein
MANICVTQSVNSCFLFISFVNTKNKTEPVAQDAHLLVIGENPLASYQNAHVRLTRQITELLEVGKNSRFCVTGQNA